MSEFKKIIEIDLYHLDEAWVNLPQITEDMNTDAVEADIAAMNAKDDLEDKRAFLDQDIRSYPENYGLSKITEASVISAVNGHPDIQALNEVYREYVVKHKRLKSKCNTLITVEKSLKGLTMLYESGYFLNKPILASSESVSTMKQERETSKLNTASNKSKIMNAKTKSERK